MKQLYSKQSQKQDQAVIQLRVTKISRKKRFVSEDVRDCSLNVDSSRLEQILEKRQEQQALRKTIEDLNQLRLWAENHLTDEEQQQEAIKFAWRIFDAKREYVNEGGCLALSKLFSLREQFQLRKKKKQLREQQLIESLRNILVKMDSQTIAKLPVLNLGTRQTNAKTDRNKAHLHFIIGYKLVEEQKYQQGVAEYDKVIELDPMNAQARVNKGLALRNLGRLEESAAQCRQAISLEPKNPNAHNNLGATLRSMGKYQQAISEYKRAIDLNPKYADAHNNMGIALRSLRRYKQAMAEYKMAIAIDPGVRSSHCNLVSLLKLMSQGGQLAE